MLYGRDLWCLGGAGKAEPAKLPGAGIGPKQCPGNARQKKDSLPKSVRIARKSTLAQNGQRERCEGVVCGRLREYAGETNARWWWERAVKRAFLLFRFRPLGRFLIQLSNSFKLLRVAASLVQEHASVIVYVDPEIQSSIVVGQI